MLQVHVAVRRPARSPLSACAVSGRLMRLLCAGSKPWTELLRVEEFAVHPAGGDLGICSTASVC